MTIKELSQLYWLKKEIAKDQERLEELERLACSPGSPNYDGMPKAPGYSGNKIERYVADILDLRAIIDAKRQQCIHEQLILERYIASIDDSLTRQIFEARFVDCRTWLGVALKVGGGNTEDSVKKICYRYLERTTAEENT